MQFLLRSDLLIGVCFFGTALLSPDFDQMRRWAVREMGLEDYT
jgi:hypothetical protein